MTDLLQPAIAWVKTQMAITAGHDWGHIQRVMKNGERLAKKEGADPVVVQLACAMHDVVNLSKSDPRRKQASTIAAEKAAQWLQGRLEEDRIELVYEAIKCHSFSAGFVPESLEARVVSDADNLDALGAIGIARTFECGGAMGCITVHPDDPLAQNRMVDDGTYTLDHFFAKLLKLGDRFYTDAGKEESSRRMEFMEGFIRELYFEVTGREAQSVFDDIVDVCIHGT